MKSVLLYIILSFIVSTLYAQIDKERFEEIFNEEEFDSKYSTRENHSSIYQYTNPQAVPDWFLNPPVSQNNKIYSIGISDPETDTVKGLEVAIYRAQIMANIFKNSTTQLLCDFFVNETNQSSDIVYEHFSRINTKIPLESKFEVVETFRNSFDETLVLLKYHYSKKPKSKEQYRVMFELYKNEIETSSIGQLESIYELRVQSNSISIPDPMFYQLTELGKSSDVISAVDNNENQVPIYSLQYQGIPNTDSVKYCYFTHGLWKEYFRSVMVVILSKAREKPENIQYLSDSYNKNSFQKTTRGISVNRMSFVLSGIASFNNQIKVTLQEVALDR